MADRADVRRTYDRIATHFAKTRPEPWPEVSGFLEGRSGVVGADIGTGNGRHAEALAERVERVVGVDASRGALATAGARAAAEGFPLELVQADAATLPIGSDRVDIAVYIATLHHLPTPALRRRSLDELARILTPTGAGIVSAWSTTHDRFDRDAGFDTTVDWRLPDGETVPRYYHIYAPDEFEAAIAGSELEPESVFTASGNCYAIVRASKQ